MEYESRRDADDAYHEMHNKRIGRDEMLKIEVGISADRRKLSLKEHETDAYLFVVGSHSTIRLMALRLGH